jgi:hypothetical protein
MCSDTEVGRNQEEKKGTLWVRLGCTKIANLFRNSSVNFLLESDGVPKLKEKYN